MIANYTMTFRDFLDTYEQSTEWQAIKTELAQFPSFYCKGILAQDGTSSVISTPDLYTMLIDKYEIYEIGAETPDLFVNAVRDRVRVLLQKYSLKIGTLNQIVYSLNTSGKSDALTNAFEIEITDDFVNAGYVYPINATASKMSGKTENSGTRKQKIPLSNRSHIELVKEILSLPDVYSQLLDEFGYCFMSIY